MLILFALTALLKYSIFAREGLLNPQVFRDFSLEIEYFDRLLFLRFHENNNSLAYRP